MIDLVECTVVSVGRSVEGEEWIFWVEPRLSEARNSGERRTGCYGELRTGVTNKQTNKHNADDDLMGAVLITAVQRWTRNCPTARRSRDRFSNAESI